ncbi:MAG: hypothetical protein IEMM0008_1765 [bacterium]|nr:MAG: hypothetical protein IEMM0008_1765 [bacterium]
MKKITFTFLLAIALVAFISSFYGIPKSVYVDSPCYVCDGGGYVCYKGNDTSDKRKNAKGKYKCKVTGLSSCTKTNCKNRFVSSR